jgi:hypothetical protein
MMYSPSDQEIAVELARLERQAQEDDLTEQREMLKQRARLHKVTPHVTGKQLLVVAGFFIFVFLLGSWALWNMIKEGL